MPDIREKILAFINSPKDVPLLAGFSLGFYVLLFYYAKNFSLANSLQQLLFFTGYYILVPVVVLYLGYKILGLSRFVKYRRSFLFFAMVSLFAFYLLQLMHIGPVKRIVFGVIVLLAIFLSFKIAKYYKLFIVLIFVMSCFNLYEVAKIFVVTNFASNEWRKLPDDIESVVFKERPNIYYIQPDGYASPPNLESPLYNFDNSEFNSFLKASGFKTYNSFRSNYYSTLLSNSSMFAMKHHYTPGYMDPYGAREVIISDNPVLRILKHNKYKTHLFTERPYLIINRPQMGYDYCNFSYSELPYIMDGWNMYEDFSAELSQTISNNPKEGNFYFIEAFMPGHINNSKASSEGVGGERERYLGNLKEANVFLKKVISVINEKDPGALVIIGADHGGFVGFEYTLQAQKKTADKALATSMFGAHLSIKWNRPDFMDYDTDLRSSVNLFRTVFSYLSKDKKYLSHLQENSSYIMLHEPAGLYRYIDDKGNIVFKKANGLQD
jgi:hypothetical protein